MTKQAKCDMIGMQMSVSEGLSLLRSRHAQSNILARKPLTAGQTSFSAHLQMTAQSVGGFAMPSGIYQITNQRNGKRYIGSTVNLRRRWSAHLRRLRRGQHGNQHLQRSFDKHREAVFMFSVLEHIEEPSQLLEREQHFLDMLSPEYNILPTAGSPLGCKRSIETRRRVSEARRGKHHSEKTREKIAEAHRGKPLSADHRAKLSKAHMGNRLSDESRRKLSIANMGHPVSEETRRKISQGRKDQRLSEQTKRKISATLTAYWHKHQVDSGTVEEEESQ